MSTRLAIGDRVERLLAKRGEPAGTVVRLVQENPQLVEVSWDGDSPPFALTIMPASKLVRLPT